MILTEVIISLLKYQQMWGKELKFTPKNGKQIKRIGKNLENIRLPPILDHIGDAIGILNNTFIGAANRIIPKSSGIISNKSLPWWSEEIRSAIREKKKSSIDSSDTQQQKT